MTARYQYTIPVNLGKISDLDDRARAYMALMAAMTSANPIDLTYAEDGDSRTAHVKIVGVRQIGPDRYNVTAEDALPNDQ